MGSRGGGTKDFEHKYVTHTRLPLTAVMLAIMRHRE